MKYLARAYHDTFDNHIVRTVLLIIGGAAISFGATYFQLGPKEAMLELPYIYAGLAGTVGPLLALYFWNQACTPYRVQKDRADALEAANRNLQKLPGGADRRIIPPQLKVELRTLFANEIGGVPGIWLMAFTNEECSDLAQEFLDVFIDAGAVKPHIGMSMGGPASPKLRDIHIHAKGDVAPKLVADFSSLLSKYGLKNEVIQEEGEGPTPFRMVINRPS